MNTRTIIHIVAIFLMIFVMSTGICAKKKKVSVFVSIIPQEFFVERIGGDRVTVQAMVKPGSSPATYEPTPRQIATLSKADLFFHIGVAFENAFLPKIRNTIKRIQIVDTRKGIKLRNMKGTTPENSRIECGTCSSCSTGTDPHIWLNPQFVKIQARTIADILSSFDPAGADVYNQNYIAFVKELDNLDKKLAKVFASIKGKTFMVFHPAWGYFADAYGLKQEPIEVEGKESSGRQLARIIEKAKAEGVQVIFVQPQFSKATAGRVADAINGAVVPIDPLARNYISNLESVAFVINNALAKQK